MRFRLVRLSRSKSVGKDHASTLHIGCSLKPLAPPPRITTAWRCPRREPPQRFWRSRCGWISASTVHFLPLSLSRAKSVESTTLAPSTSGAASSRLLLHRSHPPWDSDRARNRRSDSGARAVAGSLPPQTELGAQRAQAGDGSAGESHHTRSPTGRATMRHASPGAQRR